MSSKDKTLRLTDFLLYRRIPILRLSLVCGRCANPLPTPLYIYNYCTRTGTSKHRQSWLHFPLKGYEIRYALLGGAPGGLGDTLSWQAHHLAYPTYRKPHENGLKRGLNTPAKHSLTRPKFLTQVKLKHKNVSKPYRLRCATPKNFRAIVTKSLPKIKSIHEEFKYIIFY